MKIKTVSIILNLSKPIALDVLKKLLAEAKNTEIKFQIEKKIAKKIGLQNLGVDFNKLKKCDIVIVIGGDGTFISAAHTFYKYQIPLLGIHIGSLGFLTEFKINEIKKLINYIVNFNLEVEDRMMINVSLERDKKVIKEFVCMNEAVISKGGFTRIIKLKTYVDYKYVGTFSGDGIMVSTPTGSTAYSLSAGGPIVVPMTQLLILNTMCPHTFASRPIIIPADSIVLIQVISDFKDIMLTVDGHKGLNLKYLDKIVITKSKYFLKVVLPPNRNFFDILREKFNWVD